MSCPPSYQPTYQPEFTPRPPPSIGENPATDCAAPNPFETRSRLTNETLYRSKGGGPDKNNISVQFNAGLREFYVYVNGMLMETLDMIAADGVSPGSPVGCIPNSTTDLRSKVNAGSAIIEMPTIDYGGTDATSPTFTSATDDECLVTFGPTNLAGGDGPPDDPSLIAAIRTGPQRTMVILRGTEIDTNTVADNGRLIEPPPPTRRVLQYNGTTWISYRNLTQGDCPIDG